MRQNKLQPIANLGLSKVKNSGEKNENLVSFLPTEDVDLFGHCMHYEISKVSFSFFYHSTIITLCY